MAKEVPSDEWSSEAVHRQLKANSASGEPAAAQVFFDESVSADQLSEAVAQAIDQAAARLHHPGKVEIGRVSRLAKSVSVKGDPDVIAELTKLEPVKTVLPSQVADIYPKPVRKKLVP